MFKRILILILSIVLLLLVPVFLFLVSPILVYRLAVIRLSKWCRPSFDSILDPCSSIFANIDLYKEPLLGTAAVLVFNGRLELEQVCESFQERILNLRNPVNGELLYSKITQKVSQWLGYYFWEPDAEFDFKSHFKVHNEAETSNRESVVTQEDLLRIIEGIMSTPFPSDKSPWQITLVHNARLTSDPPGVRNKSVIIIHFHHALNGGGSTIDVLRAWCSDPTLLHINHNGSSNEANYSNKMLIKKYVIKLATVVKLVFCGPYELLSQLSEARDQNQWTRVLKTEWLGKCNTDISEPIPLKLIKAIKSLYKTSFMAVILAAYAGGVKAFMVNNGIPVPSSVHCMIPVQFTTVNSSSAIVKLPLGIADSQTRLRDIDQRLQKIKHLSVFTLNTFLQSLIGRFPKSLMFSSTGSFGNTTMLTNTPGPSEKVILCNIEGAGVMSYVKLVPGLSLSATVITYNDHLRLTLGADQSIIPLSQPMKDLNFYITEELSKLLTLEIV